MDPISSVMHIAGSGMSAQSVRLRVVAENIANASSTATEPGGDPYRRKTVTFDSVLDRSLNAEVVKLKNVGFDRSDFQLRYDPHHPAADESGYVKMPNVNTVIEMTDMREASRSFEANLTVMEQAKSMMNRTLDILRNQ